MKSLYQHMHHACSAQNLHSKQHEYGICYFWWRQCTMHVLTDRPTPPPRSRQQWLGNCLCKILWLTCVMFHSLLISDTGSVAREQPQPMRATLFWPDMICRWKVLWEVYLLHCINYVDQEREERYFNRDNFIIKEIKHRISYRIAGNFWGRKLLRIGKRDHFADKTFVEC